jgi:general secretion pathway protein C
MYRADLIARYPKLLSALNVVVAFLLLILILIFARDVLSLQYKKEGNPVFSPRDKIQKTKRGFLEYEGIMKNNPFGFPGGQLKQLLGTREGSTSQADFQLIGTVAGIAGRSYAIVADKSGKQEVVKVGESVFGAGKLKRVETDKIFISGEGREIKIPLTDVLTIKDLSASSNPTTTDFARSVGKDTFIVDQKKVFNALESPNQLMTDARLQPNFINSKQEGFTLREVRNGGIYQSLGLRNGDVLLRINENTISNPENALQAFTALRGMDRVQLDIMRDGSRMTMTYQIR